MQAIYKTLNLHPQNQSLSLSNQLSFMLSKNQTPNPTSSKTHPNKENSFKKIKTDCSEGNQDTSLYHSIKIRNLQSKEKSIKNKYKFKTQIEQLNGRLGCEGENQESCQLEELLGEGFEIKVMRPNALMQWGNNHHKSQKLKNKFEMNTKLCNKNTNTKQSINQKFYKNKRHKNFVQSKIQLKNLYNPERSQSRNFDAIKQMQNKGGKQRAYRTKTQQNQTGEVHKNQFCSNIKKITNDRRRESSGELWSKMSRSLSNNKLEIRIKSHSKDHIDQYKFQNEKIRKKVNQLKEINLIRENLSDFDLQALLNQLDFSGIIEARWPILIVDRVYQILKTKQYREGMGQISREY